MPRFVSTRLSRQGQACADGRPKTEEELGENRLEPPSKRPTAGSVNHLVRKKKQKHRIYSITRKSLKMSWGMGVRL